MDVLLGLVCEDAHPDARGNLDVRGVFSDLYAPSFPAVQDRLVLVLTLEWDRRDEGRFRFRVDLTSPGGEVTATVDGESDVTPRPDGRPPPRTPLVMPMEEIVFPEPGPYRFRVRMKGETLEGPVLYLVEQEEAPRGPSLELVDG